MDDAAQLLLIIVSSALTVFLVALVIALVFLIQLLRRVKRLSERADHVADSVEAAANAFQKTAAALAIFKFVSSIIKGASRSRRN